MLIDHHSVKFVCPFTIYFAANDVSQHHMWVTFFGRAVTAASRGLKTYSIARL